ncbi:hypothetical protein LY90DRAFT_517263 [Neocallimastix californiae]|uniref:Uncharacterized protein n=1 Tax=Neocallimastix californiae TaxID=1754190 RepID=A0A1Y2ABJ5_9FUNG|nr:hypothetical protein LY90DRAFT_517263 [Neocallimastix californiae]|eukprot:ORY19650.1 hypothetical protein LY90DRAFT_517263 [Neocallimastix californiae]
MKGLTIVDDNAVSESTDIVIDRIYNSFTVFPLDYIDITETNRYSTTKEIRIKIENLIQVLASEYTDNRKIKLLEVMNLSDLINNQWIISPIGSNNTVSPSLLYTAMKENGQIIDDINIITKLEDYNNIVNLWPTDATEIRSSNSFPINYTNNTETIRPTKGSDSDNNINSDGSGVLNDNEVYFKRRIERIIERGNINGYCDYESVAKLYNNKNTYTIQNYNHWADSLDKLVEHDKLVFQSVTQDSYIPIMDSITLPAITDNGNVTFNISDFNSSYDEGNLNALNHYKR